MITWRGAPGWSVVLVGSALLLEPGGVAAKGRCSTVDVDFTPAANSQNAYPPQIVAWIEDAAGTYLDTVYITQETGSFGIGNRPGRFDFNSGPRWPYGRRTTVFPVWAHRHGLQWDQLVFQDGHDSDLSHEIRYSSSDPHFCAPRIPDDTLVDAVTCASVAFTDKGMVKAGAGISLYPPRNDLVRASVDDPSVEMFGMLNPFDAVSQATPPPGTPSAFSWSVPETLPFGDYVLFVEVSRELDMNASYNPSVFPAPTGIAYGSYGLPYRGQPSVVYKLPFAFNAASATAITTDYLGYGDPTGEDGAVRPPDSTITGDVPGSGSSRLQLMSSNGEMYRVHLSSQPQVDDAPPAAPAALQVVTTTSRDATLAFTAPGDDGTVGTVKQYDVRLSVGEMTAASFETATPVTTPVVPAAAGSLQQVQLSGLLPETTYSIGVRAIDDCRNPSELGLLSFTTAPRDTGDIDACFVATAAYGSVMARDVELLRHFRDALLRKTVLGELAVEAYYTFGPAVAGFVGESDLLRATARDALRPVVDHVRGLRL